MITPISHRDYSRTDSDAQQRCLADLTELEAEVLAALARSGTKAGKLFMGFDAVQGKTAVGKMALQ